MLDPSLYFVISIKAFISTYFAIRALYPLSNRIGLVDHPGGRKWHDESVPLIGGITIFFGLCISLLTSAVSLQAYHGLFAGSALLILVGVIDDFRELGSKRRLLAQLVACYFLMFWGGKVVNHLGDLLSLGQIILKGWGYPVTAIMVIGYINAMNMMDGQDGLAGGIAFTQTLFFLALSIQLNLPADAMLLTTLSALLLAFLLFNLPLPWQKRARIFLGDAGSTLIAFIIAWFAVDISQSQPAQVTPITVLWILALPLFDLVNVCTHRIANGLSPFRAGRDHLHHILQAKGVNSIKSTYYICTLSFMLGLLGISLNRAGIAESWSLGLYLSTLAIYLSLIKQARLKVALLEQA